MTTMFYEATAPADVRLSQEQGKQANIAVRIMSAGADHLDEKA